MSAAEKSERLHQLLGLAPAVARLKQIATQSQDAILMEGAVNPDHRLLDLCADALHYLSHAEKALGARRRLEWLNLKGEERDAAVARDRQLFAEWQEFEGRGKPPLMAISKLKATTAAGIYAKAMVVRASKTGASGLAMTLAADLLDCPGLRASLWPGVAAQQDET
jgi:hypothetical protein